MTEESQTPPAASADEENAPYFALRGQYIRDLSLENPRAPESLMSPKGAPKVDLNVDLEARQIESDMYELGMRFTVNASAEEPLFLVELTYSGLFAVANIPADRLEGALMVDGALMLFPFARRVIADVTRDAGFPPLLLEPIDFYRLYVEKLNAAQPQAAGNA